MKWVIAITLSLSVLACVGAGFTPIVADMNYLQDKDVLNELVTTYREHCEVLEQGGYHDDVASGDTVQIASFWSEMQSWLSNNCVSFLDEGRVPTFAGYSDTNYSEQKQLSDYVPQYSYTSWLDEAGMSTGGFRRATSWDPGVDDWTDVEDDMFSYGFMQSGDILGPWILDDLQKGFTALKRTYENTAENVMWSNLNVLVYNNQINDRGDAISWTNSYDTWTNRYQTDDWKYGGTSVGVGGDNPLYQWGRYHAYDTTGPNYWERHSCIAYIKPKLTISTSHVPVLAYCYAFPRKPATWTNSWNQFYDPDHGWTENVSAEIFNGYWAADQKAVTGTLLTANDFTHPQDRGGAWPSPKFGPSNKAECAMIEESSTAGGDWDLTMFFWILDWDFTYEN